MVIWGMVTLTTVVHMHMISDFQLSLIFHKLNFLDLHLVGPFYYAENFHACLLASNFEGIPKYSPGKCKVGSVTDGHTGQPTSCRLGKRDQDPHK